MRIITLIAVALTASFVAFVVAQAQDDAPKPSSARWEYNSVAREKIVDLAIEAKKSGREFDPKADGLTRGLNLLAEDGWELIAIDPAHRFEGVLEGGNKWSSERASEYIFLRTR